MLTYETPDFLHEKQNSINKKHPQILADQFINHNKGGILHIPNTIQVTIAQLNRKRK